MSRNNSRAATLLMIEARVLYRVMDDTSGEDESEEEVKNVDALAALANARYWGRYDVLKAATWYPDRVYGIDPVRSRRDFRLSVDDFNFLIHRISKHPVFKRVLGKQEQAPVQLQCDVFIYALQSLTYHQIVQHFGVGEGMMCLI